MKPLFYFFGCIVISGITFNPVLGQHNRMARPFQLQGIVSNLGFGGTIGYHVSPQWMLGGEFCGLAVSLDKKSCYDKVNHSLMTLPLFIRYYPDFQSGHPKWCEMIFGGIYGQIGVAGRKWKFETINRDMNTDGVKAVVEFSPVTTFIGVGSNWIFPWGLSLGIGADLFPGAKPGIEVTGGPTASMDDIASTRSDVEQHHNIGATTMGLSVFVGYDF